MKNARFWENEATLMAGWGGIGSVVQLLPAQPQRGPQNLEEISGFSNLLRT